jgi:hypothetical protein
LVLQHVLICRDRFVDRKCMCGGRRSGKKKQRGGIHKLPISYNCNLQHLKPLKPYPGVHRPAKHSHLVTCAPLCCINAIQPLAPTHASTGYVGSRNLDPTLSGGTVEGERDSVRAVAGDGLLGFARAQSQEPIDYGLYPLHPVITSPSSFPAQTAPSQY